jgi:hypothetical protein
MKSLILILSVFLFVVSSCYYVNNDAYFVDVQRGELPNVILTTNLDTVDSIIIRDSLLFKYEISIDTGNYYLSRLYLDNYYIFVSDSIRDSLWINPTYIDSSGVYLLEMLLYYQTNSGNLADKINTEFVQKDTSWSVTIIKEEAQK